MTTTVYNNIDEQDLAGIVKQLQTDFNSGSIANGNATITGNKVFSGNVRVNGTFDLAGTDITATGAEINVLHSQTATTAELSDLHGRGTTVTIALAAGAANVCTITVTVKDAAGATVTGVHTLTLFMSNSATGVDLTSTSYSGTLVAATGKILVTDVAKKMFRVQTDANGVFVGSLTDTGKPATEYVVVQKPRGTSYVVSAATGTTWG